MQPAADPYSPSHEERRRSSYEFLDQFCVARDVDPVLWIVAPTLRALYGIHGQGGGPVGQRAGRTDRAFERTASAVLARVRPSGQDARYVALGEIVFLFSTRNERQKMEPILAFGGVGEDNPRVLSVQPARDRLRELTRTALRFAVEFEREAQAAGVGLPCPPRLFVRQFIGAARHMAYTEMLVERHAFRAVVVGTNHAKHARALTAAARRRHIPSVYIPHAPLVTEPRLNDLPYDFAGLRGSAEIAWYRDRGFPDDRLEVTGDPGLGEAGLVDINPSAPIVFAPSPYDAELVQRFVDTVAEGVSETVVVAPHPAQDLRVLRKVCPADWEISSQRTYDLLRESGATAVIQHSSGVALEALLLGLPTVELTLGNASPHYPLINPEYIHLADSPDDLRQVLAAARIECQDEGRRRRLQSWAEVWCGRSGEDAAAAGWSLATRAATAQSPPGPIWDAWDATALQG